MKYIAILMKLIYLACTAGAVWYVCNVAENRYDSIAHFSISREDSSQRDTATGLLGMMGDSATSNTDALTAIGFIRSANLLVELEKEFDLHKHYSASEDDILFRLEPDAPLEDRLEYYRKRISVEFNDSTGLTELTVQAYSPEAAEKVAKRILEHADTFINELNQTIAHKRMEFITSESKRAHDSVKSAKTELLAFQNKHQLIDPSSIIESRLTSVQELKQARIKAEIELESLKLTSPNSPAIKSLDIKLKSLQTQIERQEAEISGESNQKLNQLLAEHKELTYTLEQAQRLMENTDLLREKTRVETLSKSRFFSVIQNPYTPEEHAHPKRVYLTITILLCAFVIYYILKSILTSIFDRQ